MCDQSFMKKMDIEFKSDEVSILNLSGAKFKFMSSCFKPKYSPINQIYTVICSYSHAPREKLAIFVLDNNFREIQKVDFTVEKTDPSYNFNFDFEYINSPTDTKSSDYETLILIYDRPSVE